jgi:hypothetical protein
MTRVLAFSITLRTVQDNKQNNKPHINYLLIICMFIGHVHMLVHVTYINSNLLVVPDDMTI